VTHLTRLVTKASVASVASVARTTEFVVRVLSVPDAAIAFTRLER
jgi:hypothetical protein